MPGLDDATVNPYEFTNIDQYSMGDGQWHRYDFIVGGDRIDVLRDGSSVANAGHGKVGPEDPTVLTLARGESRASGGGARAFLDDIWICSLEPEAESEASSDGETP